MDDSNRRKSEQDKAVRAGQAADTSAHGFRVVTLRIDTCVGYIEFAKPQTQTHWLTETAYSSVRAEKLRKAEENISWLALVPVENHGKGQGVGWLTAASHGQARSILLLRVKLHDESACRATSLDRGQ